MSLLSGMIAGQRKSWPWQSNKEVQHAVAR